MPINLDQILDIMARLRAPKTGCPWDLEQTFLSIAPYTIEEAYEVADAIEQGDMDALRDELGDLLFQVVFHARMAEEAGHFDFAAVVQAIADQMSSGMRPSPRQATKPIVGRNRNPANVPRSRQTRADKQAPSITCQRHCLP